MGAVLSGDAERASRRARPHRLVIIVLVAALGIGATALPGGAAVDTSGDPSVDTSGDPSVDTSDDPSVDELRDDLERTEDAIEGAQDELARTRDEKGSVAAQVRASDLAIAALEAELAALQAQLADAEAAAEAAAVRTEEARAELVAVDAALRTAEAELAATEELLSARAVSAYKYGNVTVADVVVESDTVSDYVASTYYLRSVLLSDVEAFETVERLRAQLAAELAEADRLRELMEAEQAAADEARAELVDLTAAQERVAAMAAEERERRARLLVELEVAEAATEAQIAELEAESAALEDELRSAQWRAGAPGEGTWVWPTSGTLTSPFGYRTHPIYGGQRLHAGIDVGAPSGQPIVAANDGLVIGAYCQAGGYGCRVVLDHGGGFATLYAHMSSFAVAEGQVVTAGQTIGAVGSTGASTGPHLHFEVRQNGLPTDPMARF